MVSLCIPSPFSWSLDQEFDSPCMDVAELGPSSNSNFGEVDLMFWIKTTPQVGKVHKNRHLKVDRFEYLSDSDETVILFVDLLNMPLQS